MVSDINSYIDDEEKRKNRRRSAASLRHSSEKYVPGATGDPNGVKTPFSENRTGLQETEPSVVPTNTVPSQNDYVVAGKKDRQSTKNDYTIVRENNRAVQTSGPVVNTTETPKTVEKPSQGKPSQDPTTIDRTTRRGVLGYIGSIADTKPEEADYLLALYDQESKNPDSPYFYPYDEPTSSYYNELSQVYNLGENWVDDLSFLKEYYTYLYTSNGSIQKPTKAMLTEAQSNGIDPNMLLLSYDYYKASGDHEVTQKASGEWEQLMSMIDYYASSDENLSYDQIIELCNVDKNFPTLAKMDLGISSGKPLPMTSSVGYSKDAMYGAIWAARNKDAASSNMMFNAARYAAGRGVQWQEDEAAKARYTYFEGNDQYAPCYTQTNMTETALKLGMSAEGFTPEWFDSKPDGGVQTNWDILYQAWSNGNGATLNGVELSASEVKRIYEAEQFTRECEAEMANAETT